MRKLFVIIATFVAATSCLHDNGLDVPQPFEVNIDAGVATKMVLDEGSIKWENGDKIAVVFTHPSKKTYVNNDYSTGFEGNTSKTAKFVGSIDGSVNTTTGYDDIGFAVYPHDAVTSEGQVKFNLPAVQTARENGSYAQGLNLSSSVLSLNDIREDGHASAFFRNALASLRFKLSPDVLELTITGTSPLTGIAPLKMYYNADDENDTNNGRMIFDEDGGVWSQPSNSMTLKPHGDAFASDVTYNLLMWPGSHNSLTLNITYKNLGVYEKVITFADPYEFKANKYYNLNLTSTEEPIVTEITGKLDEVKGGIPSFDELEKMEGDISKIVSRIQSMTLLSEYLDNAVYANYAQFNSGLEKLDITLDYIVKPVAAAEALVNAFETDHSVASAVVSYVGANGLEVNGSKLSVKEMQLVEMEKIGKVLRVTMDASEISKDFYDGKKQATLAFQVSDGNSDVLSDFAKLVSKAGNAITGSYLKNIPAIPGARVVIPFQFAVADPNGKYSLQAQGTNTVSATFTQNSDFKTGHLSVTIDESKPIESQKVTLQLVAGSDIVYHEFTFVDSGSRIEFTDPGQVDYIGGDIVLEVKGQGIKDYMLSSSGAGVSQSGNIFTFAENTGAERTANVDCQATISGVSLNYYKSFTLTQRAVNAPLVRSYYTHAQKVALKQANASGCSNYFNIVILGDGYKMKDLAVGGKFERSARSAMDSFFAIEPYATFKDRFNVYMMTYESTDEGTDITSSGVAKNTYFNSYCKGGGNTAAFVDATGESRVITAVQGAVGTSDAAYYRSIAILLVNTDENAGSTGYPFRDYKSGFANGYASFAIAVLAANSTGTNGLVKHEAGGHAFGRLADEYYTKGNTASAANKTDLSNWHAKGWYWNVNPSNTQSYYKFNVTSYSSDELSFIEGAWGYEYGMYRPTQGGMMQGSTGVFNAPSRHAIYHRIITESQGVGAYNINNFLQYDQKNR